MKKIAIIGSGTAGCLTAAYYTALRYKFNERIEIDWYTDPGTKPITVGEGSLLDLPEFLSTSLDFNVLDLQSIKGTVKTGIKKYNWSDVEEFEEVFTFGKYAMHFNAVELQEFIRGKLKHQVNYFEQKVSDNNIDADYIINSTGFPGDFTNFHQSEYIPVNTAFVTQCYWDLPRFNHTLTIARPYGWVFGIPLANRCAIGYMFNDTINTLEEIQEDVKNVFKQFNLTPSTNTNHLSFKNYYRKQNFTERLCYNGNASFFLEPLEATTISNSANIRNLSFDLISKKLNYEACNQEYLNFVNEAETIIMLHYCIGSKFKTPFWEFAQERGQRKISNMLTNSRFRSLYDSCKTEQVYSNVIPTFGTWDVNLLQQNLYGLNMIPKLDKIIQSQL